MEIMTEILALCVRPTRKTRIMYQINLSHTQLRNYLEFLTAQGLLGHNSPAYITTEKGQRLLKAFANINDVLENRANNTSTEILSESYREIRIIRVGKRTVLNSFSPSQTSKKPQNMRI